MSKLAKVIAPVGRAVRAFFKADLRLRRDDGGLHIVLDESKPRAGKPPVPETPRRRPLSDKERRELARMLGELTALLDQTPGGRAALQPLAMVEQGLRRKGLRALDKLPLPLLQRAHTQLEGLVTNWSQEGLACLRSKMAVAVMEREVPSAEAAPVSHAEDIIEDAPLSHPMPLDEADALEAEQALLAAYGGLSLAAPAAPLKVEMQGELDSPSARALARESKAVAAERVDLRLRELQD